MRPGSSESASVDKDFDPLNQVSAEIKNLVSPRGDKMSDGAPKYQEFTFKVGIENYKTLEFDH